MAGPRGGSVRDRNPKKKKQSAARQKRVSQSKRANVRGGESASGFGLPGAGGNVEALRAAGSPEAQQAFSRPLTPEEEQFGANPFVPPGTLAQSVPTTSLPPSQFGPLAPTIENAARLQQAQPQATPNQFGATGISEATPGQRAALTPVGGAVSQFAGGALGLQDPAGRSLASQSTASILGTLAGIGLSLVGVGSIASIKIPTTAVSRSLQIGKAGKAAVATSSAKAIATNTKTTKQTASWLSRLARSARSPGLVAAALIPIIGSYPFAGFIKEEALQTLSLGVGAALRNNDLDGAQTAIDFQNELLNPTLWDSIYAGVPFVNVLVNLKDFNEAARIKSAIDQKTVNDLRTKAETGESDDEFYARIIREREERDVAEKEADNVYWANVTTQRTAAKVAGRVEDEAYWNRIMAEREADEAAKRKANEDYWAAYWRNIQKMRDDSAPSKLNFGLL